MSKLVPIGLGAAAVIAVLFLGSQFIGSPTSNVGGPASQPPATAAPSDAPASAAPPISPPPLTQSFTSQMHGVSLSYPEGWTARAATEPWTSGIPDWVRTDGDVMYHTGNLWIMVASQPLAGTGGEEWVDDLMTELVSENFCESSLGVAIEIDGAQGMRCPPSAAAVSAGDRGYLILLYASGDDPAAPVTYDQAWFEEVLATVQLQPEDAVDAAP